MRRMDYRSRLMQLDALLVAQQSLWQPLPFTTARPEWCQLYPELTRALLALDESELALYNNDNEALIRFIAAYIPELSVIPLLTKLPAAAARAQPAIAPHLQTGIPGRKWQQLTALYNSTEHPGRAITEWCGGKGYLGRLLSKQWQQPVVTLEFNPQLVAQGRTLAGKYGVAQRFELLDVLQEPVAEFLRHHHTFALHACGDLHRELVQRIIETKAPAFTIVPCCYHLGRKQHYTAFNPELTLQLSREALRLAVNETVTAHHCEIEKRDRDMVWKLAFQQLWQTLDPTADYHPLNPVPKTWLNDDFKTYCLKLCQREQLSLSHEPEWQTLEQLGFQRQHDVLRLQLLRHCFRRVLELWLVMDMAVFLQNHAYKVSIHTFCARELTPRNIKIEGRR